MNISTDLYPGVGPMVMEINRLQSQLDMAYAMESRLERAGEIDRETARISMEHIGVDFGPTAPLNSFTTAPSRTNYQISQESLKETISKLIRAILDKLSEMLGNLVKYVIKGAWKSYKAEAAKEDIDDLRKHPDVVDAQQLVEALAKTDSSSLRAMGERLERYVQRFVEMDNWRYDLMTNGPYTKALRSVERSVTMLVENFSMIESFIRDIDTDAQNTRLTNATYRDRAEMVGASADVPVPPALKALVPNAESLEEALTTFWREIAVRRDERPDHSVTLQEAYDAIVRQSHFTTPLNLHMDALSASIEKLDRVSKALTSVRISKIDDDATAKLVRRELEAGIRTIAAVQRYVSEIHRAHMTRNALFDELVRIRKLVKQINEELE